MQSVAENLPVAQQFNNLAEAPGIPPASITLFMDVQKFAHIQRVAQMFAASTMVPDHFRNNVGNCAIALNLANNMQVDPFMLMQNMYIVHGKPGIEAKLVIAILNRSGKFSPLQFKLEGEGMDRKCTAYAKHMATGEICKQTVSMEMARAEGWIEKKGSKWKTMPDLMLQYRSAMFFARLYHPEALFGMRSTDELIEMGKGPSGAYEAAEAHTGLSEMIAAKKKADAQVVPLHEPRQIEAASAQEDSADTCPPEWKREAWINKRSAGFADYVRDNIELLDFAPEEIQQEVRAKFKALYPGELFPCDEPGSEESNPEHNEENKQPLALESEPDEARIRDKKRNDLIGMLQNAQEVRPELVDSAIKILKTAEHIRNTQFEEMTIEELKRLQEQINRLYAKEQNGEVDHGAEEGDPAKELYKLQAAVANLKRFEKDLFEMGLKNLLQQGRVKNKFTVQMTADECREMIREVEELRKLKNGQIA